MSILQIQDLSKSFGGLTAIDHLSLEVQPRELRCIIGPNGAGKSTLFNLICGNLASDRGQIIFNGKLLNGLDVAQRSREGIGRKFQTPTIFNNLSVAENLQVAAWGGSSIWNLIRGSQSTGAPLVEELLDKINLREKRNKVAQTLSHGEKQWLEIGMVLAGKPTLLLLDEPTAGMTPVETHKTSLLIKDISKELTTIVIEHDLKFVRAIANIITVLYRGSVLVEGQIDDIAHNEIVRHAYLGSKEL
jgi:urea transport system ATP-binding protein